MKLILSLSVLSVFFTIISCDFPKVKLNDGHEMSLLGLGSMNMRYDAIKTAIDVGYRHIDTALIYGNENDVGRAVNDAIHEGKAKREEFFIVSKVWNHQHSRTAALQAVKDSLHRANLKYFDLMLIHWPHGYAEGHGPYPKDKNGHYMISNVDYLETWQGLEDAVNAGLVKSIGLSNFNHEQVLRVIQHSKIKPAVLQVESHPHLTQDNMVQFCKQHQIVMTAHTPLGEGRFLNDAKLNQIGGAHHKSSAQVMLKFQVQRNVVVIAKSNHRERLIENSKLFDFQLTEGEMKAIEYMNKNERFIADSWMKHHKYYPFNIPW